MPAADAAAAAWASPRSTIRWSAPQRSHRATREARSASRPGKRERPWERALAALAPDTAQVLLLRDVEALSGEETAAILGIGIAAMKSRLHRARLELKERVEAILGHAIEEIEP
jgi:RNA polymerase sigma-70 factor (ECF subfamily)